MTIFQNEPTKIAEWRNLVIEGQEKAGFTLNEAMENYVVITLDAFTTNLKLVTSVVAIDFLNNVRIESQYNMQCLRSVGDQCLILAGLFPERAKRKRVTTEYFINLGRHAYYVLSFAAQARKIDHGLFYQLFENYAELIEVLSAMRGKSIGGRYWSEYQG